MNQLQTTQRDKSITPLIINTRPKPQNARFSKALQEAGFEVREMPLLTIIPTQRPKPKLGAKPGGAIITSVHAVPALAQLTENEKQILYCVGPATAEAAQEAGGRDIRTGPGHARGLADLICREKPAGHLLYPCATQPAFDMKTALTRCGIGCEIWPFYSAIDPVSGKYPHNITQWPGPVWVVLTSARLAQNFLKICPKPGRDIHIAAISTAVAKHLSPEWREVAHISSQPNTDAILHLLKKHR